MSPLVHIMLVGWPAFTLLMFALLPPRRAVLVSYIGGWLFLPQHGYSFTGLPEYTTTSAAIFSVVLGILIFDTGRPLRIRPRWFDLPMLIWCLAPFAASLANGLGAYDGMSEALDRVIRWGLPYLVGRMYFSDLEGLRELAVGIFVGGLIYMPICWFEFEMSPQLHRWVYGFHQTKFHTTLRLGGWRPLGFMHSGLMVALWMGASTLAGFFLWQRGALRRLGGLPTGYLVAVLLPTAIFCRSMLALMLLAAGLGVLLCLRYMNPVWPLLALILVPPVYMGARGGGLVPTEPTLDRLSQVFNERQINSLETRWDSEDLLVGRALKRPVFGWGGWGRMRPKGRSGEPLGITDGLWVLAIGKTGLVGLVSLFTAILLPAIKALVRQPRSFWYRAEAAPAVVIGLIIILWSIDSLLNAMVNPIYVLGIGGLTALPALRFAREPDQQPAPRGRPRVRGASSGAARGRLGAT